MAWYVTQSLLIILATFALGLIVGWLWWGRAWRRVPLGESEAVRVVSERYQTTVAERDAQIDLLGRELRERVPSVIDLRDAAEHDGPAGPVAGDDELRGLTADGAAAGISPTGGPGTDGVVADDDSAASAGPEDLAGPDDLQRIEGVGPRIAAALAGAGLDSYRAIALAETDQLSAALREAGLSFAPSLVTWPVQARLLATGNEVALAALKTELTAGRARPHRPATTSDTESTPDAEVPDSAEAADVAEASDGAEATDGAATAEPDDARPEIEPPADAEPPSDAENPDAENPSDTDAGQPEDEDEPEEDELERVEGIGPRIATALRKAGIQTYRQLAVSDASTLQAALAASGLRFTPSLPTWSRQAALLADGDEVGFLALTRTLVPDRESGRPS